MIYVCIPSHDEAATVGLLLWKIRQVFAGFPREYQMLVLDDASTDATAEILEPYSRVLPLTVVPKPEALPLTALKAPGDVNQRIAVLALLLALLSALTFILWRHHRRDYASPRRIGRRI